MDFTFRQISRSGAGDGPARDTLRKSAWAACCLLGLVSWASAQNLAEAARLEKARRARFLGKKVITATNRDLPRAAGLVPVVEAPGVPEPSAGIDGPVPAGPAEELALGPAGGSGDRKGPSGPVYSLREGDLASTDAEERQREWDWQQAKGRADNLEIAIGDYWEEYYASRDPASRRRLEQRIGEASEQLDRARQDEARAWVRMEQGRDDNY